MEPITQKVQVAPKDFFLWAGAMVALYASVIAFINLIFEYLNYLYPDPLAYQIDPYESGISGFMATVIVAFPVFLVLMRIIRRAIERDPSRQEIWVRRWAVVLTLFVAGAAIAGTLIALLSTFLSGTEITTRFLLKIATVLVVAGAGFAHFLADFKGYWKLHPLRARNLGIIVEAVVITVILVGFSIVGTPYEARLARYDAQKVRDLQNIQWQLVSYWQQKEVLPVTLSGLTDPISGFSVPSDPQSKSPYEYKTTASLSFQLCAVFNAESRKTMDGARDAYSYAIESPQMKGGMVDSWQHGAGRVCFDRTIDPERYPPLSKTQKN